MKIHVQFSQVISIENLLRGWEEFLRGKRYKSDVQDFRLALMDNIMGLHDDLLSRHYRHGGYLAFKIQDPKPRDIHKASVRDRIVHHAIYRVLYPEFDKRFIADSYSCRRGKGTHRAMNRFGAMAYEVSQNHTRTCWILKLDIRKFFANIDHAILKEILDRSLADEEFLWLIGNIVDSFHSTEVGTGLPLGNLTSQLLVNIYMNEFDQFVKHKLRVKHYIRYADDFILLSHSRQEMTAVLPEIESFLARELHLTIHPKKIELRTFASGVDFLGWVHFPDHRVLRTKTKRRMHDRLGEDPSGETLQSYLGLLSHGNTRKIINTIKGNVFSSTRGFFLVLGCWLLRFLG